MDKEIDIKEEFESDLENDSLEEHIASKVEATSDFLFRFNVPNSLLAAVTEQQQAIADALSASSDQMKIANIEIGKKLANVMLPLSGWANKVTTAVAPVSQALHAYSEALERTTEDLWQRLAEIDTENLIKPCNELASEYGWPLAYDFPVPAPRNIIDEAHLIDDPFERVAFVNDQVMQIYNNEIMDRMYQRWNRQPYLVETERLLIIEAAFEAHMNGNYALSSPAILPQVEGLFREHILDVTESGEKEHRGVTPQDYERELIGDPSVFNGRSITYVIYGTLCKFVFEYGLLGVASETTKPIAYDISRHKILHGRSTAYCRRKDISLRHLLWLDCVISHINEQK